MSRYYYHKKWQLVIKFPECVCRTPTNPNELISVTFHEGDEQYYKDLSSYTLISQRMANKICKNWYDNNK